MGEPCQPDPTYFDVSARYSEPAPVPHRHRECGGHVSDVPKWACQAAVFESGVKAGGGGWFCFYKRICSGLTAFAGFNAECGIRNAECGMRNSELTK